MRNPREYTDNVIFIVDDNPANTMMLQQVVEAEGFHSIYVYNDPEVALVDFARIKPDLVLLDLLMPVVDGLVFLNSIQQQVVEAETSVIILTASHDQEKKRSALEMGAQDFIEKPFNIIEALQRIKNVLNLQQRKKNFQNLSVDLDRKLKKTRKDLSEVLLTLNTIFDHSSEYVIVTDEAGLIIDCNKVARERLNIEQGVTNIFERFKVKNSWLLSGLTELVLSDVRSIRIIVEVTHSKVYIDKNRHLVFILRDITSRKEDEINLKYLAETHYITHLSNRNQLDTLVDEKMAQLGRNDTLSFIFVSFIENNKVVEYYGHDRVEYLLLNIAMLLVEAASETGAGLIHWGDNDFLLIESSLKSAGLIRYLSRCFERPIPVSESTDVTVYSRPIIGVCDSGAVHQLQNSNCNALVQQALAATFHGARASSPITHYDQKLHDKIQYRSVIAKEMTKAISDNLFRVAYQAKVDLSNGTIIGAEALLRWPHPEMGLIPPDVFIKVAEQVGLIKDVGTFVLTQVFNDVVQLKAKYPTIRHVAVNVSAPQLDNAFIELLEALLQTHGSDMSHFIELEITESAFIDDFVRVNDLLKQIKDMGFRLAIDDFGTGYSSLSYLHELPMDTLKIDRAFISPILTQNRSLLMVKGIVSMSLALGLDIVAEGIEDKETGELLAELGVHQGQGFYYYRPEFL